MIYFGCAEQMLCMAVACRDDRRDFPDTVQGTRIDNTIVNGGPIKSQDTVRHHATVSRERREALNGHRGAVVWFTGLSGSGKSTLAHEVEERLHQMGCRTFVFDGDNVRHGLCGDLGFSAQDRVENIRRVGEMAKLFIEAGTIALTAFISPFRADRERARQLVGSPDFIEVYCRCSIAVCESRDTKGLYARARAGEVQNFTGISSPYEPPDHPQLVVDTGTEPLDACAGIVVSLLRKQSVI